MIYTEYCDLFYVVIMPLTDFYSFLSNYKGVKLERFLTENIQYFVKTAIFVIQLYDRNGVAGSTKRHMNIR